jgi:thiamine biosynthesis protein ThiI
VASQTLKSIAAIDAAVATPVIRPLSGMDKHEITTLAKKNNCEALVTGDSVGQVASQTLKSIAAIDSAVKTPVIRPLSGMDKHEITAIARKIGTYEISIRPFEDCCTLFVPPHPETKPKVTIIENIEKRITELPALSEQAVTGARVFEYM